MSNHLRNTYYENECHLYSASRPINRTIDSQLQELREYCPRRGWTIVAEYHDTVSGTKSCRRPGRIDGVVRRGKMDVVVCVKLDRLGRSLSHLGRPDR